MRIYEILSSAVVVIFLVLLFRMTITMIAITGTMMARGINQTIGSSVVPFCGLIVYVADVVSLSVMPLLNALALTLTVPLLTEMGAE